MNDVHIEIGKRIRQKRKAAGLTQQQVADILGIRRATLTTVELGKNGTTVINLYSLCLVFGCTPNDLFPEIKQNKTNEKTKTRNKTGH